MKLSAERRRSFLVVSVIIIGLATASLSASIWFERQYVGWLTESVADPQSFLQQWQTAIDRSNIVHPAVVHWLPEGCVCNLLTIQHAGQVSSNAIKRGFNVYQHKSSHPELGQFVALDGLNTGPGPLILITKSTGELQYAGAYSDGIRCNSGTSMVEQFISQPVHSAFPIIGLDVKTCRCL